MEKEKSKNHADENQEENEKYRKELTKCPECGESVTLTDPIESTGAGIAFGYIRCEDPNCNFKAMEEWVHDKTVRMEG